MRLFCAFAVCVLCVFLVHGLALISLIQIMSAVPSSSSYHIAHTQLFYLFLSFYLSLIANRNSFQLRLLGLFFFLLFCIVCFCPLVADIWVSIDKKKLLFGLSMIALWLFNRFGLSSAMAFHSLWLFICYGFSTVLTFQPLWLFNLFNTICNCTEKSVELLL